MSATKSETLAARLQRLRGAKKLTQVELASRASVPLQTLKQWETGRRKSIAPDKMGAVAAALGCAVTELLP